MFFFEKQILKIKNVAFKNKEKYGGNLILKFEGVLYGY
jgi:hypothetical protein